MKRTCPDCEGERMTPDGASCRRCDEEGYVDVMLHRAKPTKTYTFRRNPFFHGAALSIEQDGRYSASTHDLTNASYNRYVALANSGNYSVEILDSDHGVAWLMRRKSR